MILFKNHLQHWGMEKSRKSGSYLTVSYRHGFRRQKMNYQGQEDDIEDI